MKIQDFSIKNIIDKWMKLFQQEFINKKTFKE